MGYRAVCTNCDWKSEESYLTEQTAEVDGGRHEKEEHGGENCTEIQQKPAAHS